MSVGSLSGHVAVVTGAAGGLGRAFALGLAGAGARVAAADRNAAGATETVGLIAASLGEGLAVEVDVSDLASTEQMAAVVVDRWGRIDVLVNNAGVYASLQRKPFFEITPAEWDLVMDVNLKGTWLCSRAVFPAMRDNGGSIVNISSATFYSGSANWSHYVASKGGIIGLTRSLAREAGDYGIRVNAIAPGFTLTEASRQVIEDADTYGVSRGALKRAEQPDDLVGTLVFLASSASAFVTGQTLIVDGGRQFG